MKQITILILVFFISIQSFAQTQVNESSKKNGRDRPSPERIAEIKSKKIAFFTDKMNLSSDEAQKFWPIYNEYFEKKMDLEKKKHDVFNLMKEGDNKPINNKQATIATDSLIQLNIYDAQLLKAYYSKYKEVLSPQKLLKLYSAERQFSRELIRMIKKDKNEHSSSQR